ncbi:hypothetical protein PGTUg99_020408 [Puccinia graminis f. sp. tritici]|uniref:Uncharacterized protein n=1 Tax=Puccinia graminis f. sp. tritici TaxID=56615 RepID=A0A5B0REZ1_PUCGR|nr:hypothetical protein PGTUg99_020408 [Puccinia graminis f. sp. tritici]
MSNSAEMLRCQDSSAAFNSQKRLCKDGVSAESDQDKASPKLAKHHTRLELSKEKQHRPTPTKGAGRAALNTYITLPQQSTKTSLATRISQLSTEQRSDSRLP